MVCMKKLRTTPWAALKMVLPRAVVAHLIWKNVLCRSVMLTKKLPKRYSANRDIETTNEITVHCSQVLISVSS